MFLRLFSGFCFVAVAALATGPVLWADDQAGHSAHGEAFDEGPRQAAVLMKGTGGIVFPVQTTNAEAQKFFTQGVGQLHGFWYFEAERSFRQAAALDADCAMAYWGMAMANVNNEKRAKAFLKKALERRDKGASAKDKLWITALENFYKEDKRDKKQRQLDIIRDLEAIVQDDPKNIEAKAFLAWRIWMGKEEVPISSLQAVDALLDQVFAANPQHPAHHYRIHLWDGSKPAQALKSAAECGQSAPAIAHMWHMPGHTFSKLRRFDDAAWQQEAATRVDHAYMMRDMVLPDQIHNYAHNEEWLIRTYNELGRANDALELARSLIRIPRHPVYNTLDKKNTSASYGRTRLLEALITWELWKEVVQETQGNLLGPVIQTSHEAARLRALGVAQFHLEDAKGLEVTIASLQALSKKPEMPSLKKEETKKTEAKITKAADKKEPEVKPVPAALAELRALHAVLTKNKIASTLLTAAKDMPKARLAKLWLRLGKQDKVEELLPKLPQDLAGLAAKAELQLACGKVEEAKKSFEAVRKAAYALDAGLPVAQRLTVLAKELEIKGDWKAEAPKRTDVGVRPDMASFGPVHWQPSKAAAWEALTLEGKPVSSAQYQGKPTILLFYLGAGCGHCMQQVNAFAKQAKAFDEAGLSLAAVTLEPMSMAGRITEQMADKKLPPFPIYCDPSLTAFKAFRAYDDFEEEPLHAVVLIDAKGNLRWLDISWQPFSDARFLLEEAQRLLKL